MVNIDVGSIVFLIAVVLVFFHLLSFYLLHRFNYDFGLSFHMLFGLLSGIAIGVVVFFALDKLKGWNPFGWWFGATFVFAVLYTVVSVVVYAKMRERKNTKRE